MKLFIITATLFAFTTFSPYVLANEKGDLNQSPVEQPKNKGSNVDALQLWDDNGNGRITCKEARNHGIAPVPKDHPAYPYMTDRDKDGVVCER